MFHDLLHAASVYYPIALVVLALLFAAGALLTFRVDASRVRAWGVSALLLGALVATWARGRRNERQPTNVDATIAAAADPAAGVTESAPPMLDSARTECTAAREHFGRIMLLIRNLKNAEAGVEMLASADHLERAVREVAGAPDPRTAAVLQEARARATELIRNGGAVPVSIGTAIEALGSEVDRAAQRLASTHAGNSRGCA